MSVSTATSTVKVSNALRNVLRWPTTPATDTIHNPPPAYPSSPCTSSSSIPFGLLPSLTTPTSCCESLATHLHAISPGISLAYSCDYSSSGLASSTSSVPSYHRLPLPSYDRLPLPSYLRLPFHFSPVASDAFPLPSLLASYAPSCFEIFSFADDTEIAGGKTTAEKEEEGLEERREGTELPSFYYECGFLTDIRVKQYNKIRGKPGIRKRDAGMYWANYKSKWEQIRKKKKFL
eukprot:GHVS01102556.1.p1 GENE.GHVS01102556.1~~GHVS01102556.1.p1  ORF type:complete len:234 (-),score=40.84 GHVS01102556.1:376-1077(-)